MNIQLNEMNILFFVFSFLLFIVFSSDFRMEEMNGYEFAAKREYMVRCQIEARENKDIWLYLREVS